MPYFFDQKAFFFLCKREIIFQDFDTNFDMKLDSKEVEQILSQRYALKPRTNFKILFSSFDTNHDGGLDLKGIKLFVCIIIIDLLF